ncbi:hypothetical protein Tco_1211107 [Tanacetum coccineum]
MMETMEQYKSKTRGNNGPGVEVILFYNGLDVPTRQILDSKARSAKTFNELAAIQAQLNNLGREIKKVNEKVYHAQVGCELCKGPHYIKDCPLKEEGNTLEEAYYTQFGAPYQHAGQYRATGPGFYQRNNGNSSYPDRRQTLEESLTKFMAESTKRHEEKLNIIKEIRASTDAAIRNQGASIKTLEIQIGQMSKVFTKRESVVPFPRRLQNYYCDDWREAQDVKILEAYDNTLPQKKKNPWSFTLPCFIHNVCFDKALVDLGASDKDDHEGKSPAETLKDIPIFIGNFSILTDFIIIDDKDVTRDVVLGMPFFIKYVSCHMVMKKFAHRDKCERIMEE